jgi:hypothetical protein
MSEADLDLVRDAISDVADRRGLRDWDAVLDEMAEQVVARLHDRARRGGFKCGACDEGIPATEELEHRPGCPVRPIPPDEEEPL